MKMLSTFNETFEGEGKGWGRKKSKGKTDRAQMSDKEIIVCWGGGTSGMLGMLRIWNECCSTCHSSSNAWIKIL